MAVHGNEMMTIPAAEIKDITLANPLADEDADGDQSNKFGSPVRPKNTNTANATTNQVLMTPSFRSSISKRNWK